MSASQRLWRHPEFARGARDMTGISLGIGAWGLVTGVAMVKAGLGLPLAIGMSLLVFSGSAQLAALPLIAQGAPLWVVWGTALCVNLRFVIYAAALRSHFAPFSAAQRLVLGYVTGDIGFVVFMDKLQREGRFDHPDWYFLGVSPKCAPAAFDDVKRAGSSMALA